MFKGRTSIYALLVIVVAALVVSLVGRMQERRGGEDTPDARIVQEASPEEQIFNEIPNQLFGSNDEPQTSGDVLQDITTLFEAELEFDDSYDSFFDDEAILNQFDENYGI